VIHGPSLWVVLLPELGVGLGCVLLVNVEGLEVEEIELGLWELVLWLLSNLLLLWLLLFLLLWLLSDGITGLGLEPGLGVGDKSEFSVPFLEGRKLRESLEPGNKVGKALSLLISGEEGEVGV